MTRPTLSILEDVLREVRTGTLERGTLEWHVRVGSTADASGRGSGGMAERGFGS
jgi:hypothetical protein